MNDIGNYFAWLAVVLVWMVKPVHSTPIPYTDESTFLAALTTGGYRIQQESFEDDDAWGSVRTPTTAPSIANLGITWTPNNASSGVTTGNGPVRTGAWGFFTLPHGDFANGIKDGFVGTASETLYGVGGWIETNTPPAAVELILDGDTLNPVDFVDDSVSTAHKFFGVIDTAGFTQFNFNETEAELPPDGDEAKFIAADDFTFATAVPEPAALVLAATGLLCLGCFAYRRQQRRGRLL